MSSPPPKPAPPPRRAFTAPLLRRESIGESYHVLSFDLPKGLIAQAGQFVMVHGQEWGQAPLLPRPMSLLTSGTAPSLLIKVVGEGTRRLARANPGERFQLLGPLGRGWRPLSPGKRALLVAGGVGVAPLLYLARELVAQGRRPVVVYGGRSAQDLPLDDELARVAELHVTTEDGSRGRRGRVLVALEELLTSDVEVYTCGPERMMAAVAERCREAGVPCEVSLETPMACGYGVCLGCAFKTTEGGYAYACVEGPCVTAERVDFTQHAAVGKAQGVAP